MGGLPMAKGGYTECPECGQSVLRDNLRYHQRKVHGPADAAPRRGPKRAPPPPARPNTALLMTVAVVVIAVVFGTYYVLVVAPGGSNDDGGGNGTTNPIVLMSTNYGNIRIELDVVKAPVTVANFLSHVDPGHYDNTAIHRVAANFVIQGGQLSVTADRVAWERTNLLNSRGTISMARVGGDWNSATSQFFINLRDNANLDAPSGEAAYPYAVFGRVIEGMGVVDTIGAIQTTPAGDGQPNSTVTVISVTRA